MKDIYELLKDKEEELARLTQELDAIRLVAKLMSADGSEKNRPAPSQERPRELSAPQRMKDFP